MLPDDVDLFALVCEAWRSVNRFVVPRIAPRLEAGAPGAPEVADCAFSAVFVLVMRGDSANLQQLLNSAN